MMRRQPQKRGYCSFCQAKMERVVYHRDLSLLSRFLSPRARILSRQKTRTCARHQRQLGRAIKKARLMALLPFTNQHALT